MGWIKPSDVHRVRLIEIFIWCHVCVVGHFPYKPTSKSAARVARRLE
jgi:hypothetical protein